MTRNERHYLIAAACTMAVVTTVAVLIAALPALIQPVGLLLSADYLPSACLALVGLIGHSLIPWVIASR
jgi:hypothetical protein